MNNLYIAPGIATPEVSYSDDDKTLCFKGQSFPADPYGFYRPVFNWLNDFLSITDSEKELNVTFKLRYYNTSSAKQFANLMKIIEESSIRDKVKICWYYEDYDVDMLEAGKRFSQYITLDFEIKKYQSN